MRRWDTSDFALAFCIVLALCGVVLAIGGHTTAHKRTDPAWSLIQRTRVHASDVCHANHELAVVDILDDGTVDWMCYWPQGYKP